MLLLARRHRAREAAAARATRAWIVDALEASGDAVFALDSGWRLTHVNRRAAEMWDRPAAALLGRRYWDEFPDAPGRDALLRAAEQRCAATWEAVWPGGGWVEGRVHPGAAGLFVHLRPIGERKRAEAALHESRERLAAVVGQAAVGIAQMDPDGRLVLVNDRWCAIMGVDRLDALGRRVHEVVPGADPAEEGRRLARLIETGDPYVAERRIPRPDGRSVCVMSHVSLVRDPAGRAGGAIAVVQDITHRRAAEDALRRLNEALEARIAEAVAERERAQADLRQAQRLEALVQLAGGVAHDFNNVLQAVAGGARLIQRRPTDPETVVRLAGLVLDAAERGASVTRRLLAFARRAPLRPERIDPVALLHGLRDDLARGMGGVAVRVDAPPGVPPLLADRAQLENVLATLAANGRDAISRRADRGGHEAAGPAEGGVTLSARGERVPDGARHPAGLAPGAYVRLAVSDTGAGMDPAVLAHASEPFFSVKPRGTGAGTGLGLAMARGFTEQSGGRMGIHSAPGEGTTVALWLPEAPAEAIEEVRVLLVEDDPALRDVLAEQLAEQWEVATCADAAEALQVLRAGASIHVLVSDLSMPGTDGLTLIRQAQRLRPGLPALLLTGHEGPDLDRAVADPADGPVGLLRKPVRGPDLVARLRGMLAGA